MQKSEDFKQNVDGIKKNNYFENLGKRLNNNLREKDERQVRERLKGIVRFMIFAMSAYLLGGTEFFFGTYPFILALLCSSRKKLPPIILGTGALLFLGKAPAMYGYVSIAILLIRMLATLLPFVLSELNDTSKESRGVVPYSEQNAALILNSAELNGEYRKVGGEAARESDKTERNFISECFGRMFAEPLYVRVLCAMVGGMICGFLIMLEREYSFYGLYALLALILLVPLATAVFSGVFGYNEEYSGIPVAFSLLSVMIVCILGSSGKSILGVPMSPFLAMLFTLYLSSRNGIVLGAIFGAAIGAAMNTAYLPMFLLSALLYCLISSVKKSAGIAAVCALAVVWCYYIGGERGLVEVLPSVLFALPVFVFTDKYREMMNAPYKQYAETAGNLYFAQSVTEKTKNEAAKERLVALDEAFTSLSETFYKLSDRFRRPDMLGIRKISDSCFERVCEGCRNSQICWGPEYSGTVEAVSCVNAALHIRGEVDEKDLPEDFKKRCIRTKKLTDEINKTVTFATENIIKGGKFKIFSANYEEITSILNDALDSDSGEYECDVELGDKIFEYFRACDIGVSGAVIYGKRCRHIVAKGANLSSDISAVKAEKIRKDLVEIVGAELSGPIFEVGKDGMIMLFYSKPVISASCAHGRIARNGYEWGDVEEKDEYVDPFSEDKDEACGDITDAFITDTSYFYSLISDGMGSGADAAHTAEVCSMFIQKMLMAGNRIDITLRMLNNVIRSENMGCGMECSATVDLFELDLMSGMASFVKSGAAPTYIARQGTVYKVSSRTMPVGIIKEADARITRFDTKKGDIIVMVSDGCCHDSEDCTWLVEYLCDLSAGKRALDIESSTCESLKDDILKEAVLNFPKDIEKDDISVSVIMIG